jgi:hypothetical protein
MVRIGAHSPYGYPKNKRREKQSNDQSHMGFRGGVSMLPSRYEPCVHAPMLRWAAIHHKVAFVSRRSVAAPAATPSRLRLCRGAFAQRIRAFGALVGRLLHSSRCLSQPLRGNPFATILSTCLFMHSCASRCVRFSPLLSPTCSSIRATNSPERKASGRGGPPTVQ